MKYTIRQGDTLRMVAQRELGNAELWETIVSLNKLSYPYVSDTKMAGTVVPGDTIDLPKETPVVNKILGDTLGCDLLLSTNRSSLTSGQSGDLSVGSDGDYDLVSDLDCLRQDLSHRKSTLVGSLPYHGSYGSYLPSMIGSKGDRNWRTKASLEIQRTIKCDPRVSGVKDVSVDDVPTGVSIDCTVLYKGVPFKLGGVGNEEV